MKYEERNQKTEKKRKERKKFTENTQKSQKTETCNILYFSQIVPIFITRMGGGNI